MKRTFKITGLIVMMLIASTMGFVGCGSKEHVLPSGQALADNQSGADIESTATKEPINSLQPTQSNNTTNQTEVSGKEVSNGEHKFTQYIDLLGLDKETVSKMLNEEPVTIDEGGLEFKENGIRVWFDQKKVAQVFTMRKDIDFNGAKIGDKIGKFKDAFGNAVNDKNGDAHFKFNDIFVSVNYDPKNEETFAVYLLKNDF